MASPSQVEHQNDAETTTPGRTALESLLRSLGWGSSYAARALRVEARTMQRWRSGEHPVPLTALVALRGLLVLQRVAPGLTPATLWTNGGAHDYLNTVREPARMRRAEGYRSLRDGADG